MTSGAVLGGNSARWFELDWSSETEIKVFQIDNAKGDGKKLLFACEKKDHKELNWMMCATGLK